MLLAAFVFAPFNCMFHPCVVDYSGQKLRYSYSPCTDHAGVYTLRGVDF